MHYYQFNIGDYASHTRYLTPMQDLAYRRLLDLYYLQEKPIPKENAAALIGLNDCSTDVERVLNDYFLLTEKGWVNKRADESIREFHNKQKSASLAGKKSAEARKANKGAGLERPLNDASNIVEPNIKHKTINNIKTSSICIEGFWSAYDKKVGKKDCVTFWKTLKVTPELNEIIISKAKEVALSVEPKYRKDPIRWLRGRHWEDAISASGQTQADDMFGGAL